jgi:uncharacterized protein (TIGR00661 family)
MKILYGVQATGNGHISRSREMVAALRKLGCEVFVLFSGREEKELWDIEDFSPYCVRRGLTFVTRRGKVRYLKSAMQLDFARFFRDARSFDARDFDLVVTDFEPLSAWIARRNRIPSIGVGHQYAFCHRVPTAGVNPLARAILRYYAASRFPVGLHWHHFDQPILPPIVPAFEESPGPAREAKILVYLPFEDIEDIASFLLPLDTHRFYIYHRVDRPEERLNLYFRPFSRSGFLDDLMTCSGVICNAGFELPSEALALGKKVLVRPLGGQMEQQSNALALERLGLGRVMKKLDTEKAKSWIEEAPKGGLARRPVADRLAEWIVQGNWDNLSPLVKSLWEE